MSTRSVLGDRRRRTRLVLALGIAGGLLAAVFYAFFRPNPDVTFDVFYYAARQSADGTVPVRTGHGMWVYSPPALLYFYPYAFLFEYGTALQVHRVLSVGVAVGYGAVLARFLANRADLERVDQLLVAGFTSASIFPVVAVVSGSFNVVFTAMLGIGWILMERDEDSGGALWALAAIVKGFPALWGVYMLRVRRWRSVAAAVVTGLAATGVGLVLFGLQGYVTFLTEAREGRTRLEKLAGTASPDTEIMTPVRGLTQLFPWADPYALYPFVAIAAILGLAVVYALLPTETLADRATLMLATVVAVTFVMPTSQDMDTYLVYAPLLVLLYVERDAVVHALYVAGTLLLSYNVGREELRTVTESVHGGLSDAVMAVAEPVLAFAHLPLLGLYLLFAGCLVAAWHRGRETGRTARIERLVRSPAGAARGEAADEP